MKLTVVILLVVLSSCLYLNVKAAEGHTPAPAEGAGHETPAPTEGTGHEAPAAEGTGHEAPAAEGSGHEAPAGHEAGGEAAGGHEAGGEAEHECEEHEEEGGAVGLLSLMNDFKSDTAIIWIIVGLLIIVNFFWELITDGLEHFFMETKREHIVVMLEKLYKELTIVGLWSVVIYLITAIAGDGFDEHVKHVFELIHISLFGLVLIFVSVMIFIATLSIGMYYRWRKLELSVSSEHAKNEYKKLEQFKKDHFFVSRFFIYLVRPDRYYFSRLHESRHNYFILREKFMATIPHLPIDPDDFRFDKYLKRAMRFSFIELSQVHWSVLAFVLIGILGIWMGWAIALPDDLGIPYTFIAVFCFLACLLLHWKIIMIYESLILDRNVLSRRKQALPVWHDAPELPPIEYYKKKEKKKKTTLREVREAPQRVCHYFIGIIPSPDPVKEEQHRKEEENNAHSIYHHHHQSDIVWILRLWKFIRCHYSQSQLRNFHSSTEHQKLFWLGSNFLYLYSLQLTIFWQACLGAIIIGSLCRVIEMSYFYQIFPILSTLINLFYFLPLIIYRYAFVTNVGEFTKSEIVAEQIHIHEKEDDVVPRGRSPTFI